MICSFLNLDDFIVRLLLVDGLYLKLKEIWGPRSLSELCCVLRQECRLIWINAVPAIRHSVNCVILFI